MSEMMEGGGGHDKKGKKRGKKSSPRVDMTPMVDLAFLLITFFMLTTTMSKPKAMDLNMPDKNEKSPDSPVPSSRSLTIILGKNDKVYYHLGTNEEVDKGSFPVAETDFSINGIRKEIFKKQKEVGVDAKRESRLIIVIKSFDDANYKDMVDILDEMHITQSKRYAIVDITPEDIAFVEKHFPSATL